MNVDETALDLLLRHRSLVSLSRLRTGFPVLDALRSRVLHSGRHDADVVEILGASGCGKTHLALHATLECVLPARLGGSESTCVWFDLELRLCADRLVEMLLARLEMDLHGGRLSDEEDARRTAEECMKRVVVVRCCSSLQVLCTLRALTDRFMRDANVRMMVLDCVSSFHWMDAETESVGAGLHVSVPAAVRELARKHRITVLALKHCYFRPRGTDPCPEYMSQTWHKLVGVRLFVEPLEGGDKFSVSDKDTLKRLFDFSIASEGVKVLEAHVHLPKDYQNDDGHLVVA